MLINGWIFFFFLFSTWWISFELRVKIRPWEIHLSIFHPVFTRKMDNWEISPNILRLFNRDRTARLWYTEWWICTNFKFSAGVYFGTEHSVHLDIHWLKISSRINLTAVGQHNFILLKQPSSKWERSSCGMMNNSAPTSQCVLENWIILLFKYFLVRNHGHCGSYTFRPI